MKLRNPTLIKAAAFLLSGVARAWLGTVRYRSREEVAGTLPETPGLSERFVYVFWHETMLVTGKAYPHYPARMLISDHADGELIARVVEHLGHRTVRGSTTHGGSRVLRQMTKIDPSLHLALTPDGPRGPRRKMQLGPVILASMTGRRLVPIGNAFTHCWRANSWDRFAVPCPMTPAVSYFAKPITVPPKLKRDGLEAFRQQAEDALAVATDKAEALAAKERW